jgi:signal peptidase I
LNTVLEIVCIKHICRNVYYYNRRQTLIERRRKMKIHKRNLVGTILIFLLMVSALPILGTQSDLILAGSSGAKLTGIIDNDQGFDTDGDSLFDFLMIGVQVNVTEPDTYTVGIGGLKNATSGYISVYNQTSAHLDPGLKVVNVSLSGRVISFSHINPSMVSSIYLYGGNQTYDYVHDVALSKEYSYLWFDLPGATLTGRISDKGIDTDGDDLFNLLEIGVEVNVTDAGKYTISVSNLLDSNPSPNYIYVYNSTLPYLNSGIQNVTVQLSGTHIRMSGFDPAYVSNIGLNDAAYGVSETKGNVPLSKPYSHLDFDPPKAVLTGRIFDAGIDADDDGKFDYLQIGVEINVTDPGQYSLQVSGLKDSSLNKTIDVYDYESSYFVAGVQVSNLSLYGPSIYLSHSNPRYVSSIWLYADYSSYEYDVALSQEYAYNEFDPPGAYLTGTISDSGIDVDGDGKFNYLQVGVEVNVTESGSYYIYLSGLLDANSSLYFGRGDWKYLEKGLQNVYFSLEGLRIRLSQFNAKYVNYVSMQDQGYHSLGSISNVPLSREYQYTEFELPPAELTGIIYDQGDDRDGDDLYDYLKIGVEVNVTEAGNYQAQVNQLRDTSGNYVDVYGSTYSYLDVGIRVLNVSLNGLSIYLSKRNPAYVSYIVLLDANYIELDNLGKDIPLSREYSYTEFDPPGAELTGVIFDQGVDSDEDGTYDYLQIGVEVNVIDSGYYELYVSRLRDSGYNFIEVYGSNYALLNAGLQVVYVNLEGPRIYVSHLNPRYIDYISLREQKTGFNDYLSGVPLSREYSYKEFDPPAAMLTGTVFDRGVDTDGDGAFNYLEIGVEINVTKPGNYEVYASDLRDTSGNYIWAWGQNSSYFDVGLGVLNVSIDGRQIYSSHRNPRYIGYLYLYSDIYSSLNNVALSKEYLYTEFDFPAALTGVILDRGVDTDADGLFDYLEVGVQVKVMDAGNYMIQVSGLLGNDSDYGNSTYLTYINVWDSKTTYLSPGVQIVNLYLYGPQIYVSKRNPTQAASIYLYLQERSDYYTYYESQSNIPLSREYSYIEFDGPLVDAETKFVVYPDGRVALEGTLKYTHMVPKNTGPTAQGSFSLTSTHASADLSVGFPSQLASQFPYNSTNIDLLARYSNDLLNLGMNSTMVLPPFAASQYPFNTTDGSVIVTYSGGILNVNVEGDSTIPELASQQLPFNATDISVVGTCSSNILDGTITFSVLDEFAFDDANVDFKGNQTDLALNGTVQVLFNVPLGNFIIRDENDLIQLTDQLKSSLVGEKGIVWNATGGLLNVTNLNIAYELTDGVAPGASITFEMEAHGDFLQALAYVLSGGRNQTLLYPALNEAYQSVQTGSFDIRYSHTTREASMKLTFSYDLKRLIDYVLTPPTGTTPYVMTSYTMSPTINLGDVVFVETVSNPGDIIANTETGDIIGFKYPDDQRHVMIHRAINKTQVAGTWFFQTKGDLYSSPDYWTGNNTYNGMISEQFLVGKVQSRIPFLGYLLPYTIYPYYYPYYYPYPQECVTPDLSMMKAAFDSVQDVSIRLSYASATKQFDFKLTLVDKLKELRDTIAPLLPGALPSTIDPELRSFFESLLNTTHAEISSALVSMSYDKGMTDLEATIDFAGDLNAQINYMKDLYIRLVEAQYGHFNMTIPWQWPFINQTNVDLSNFKISAKLGETTFEGKVEGIVVTPPREMINATHFRLERFFNLTAPQLPWQGEFPMENQRLRITVVGGTDATHMVTLFRPTTVPEPDSVALYSKSMTWFNQTLSSLKDLIFITGPRLTGTLTVNTTPVAGEVFVNGESWGIAPQSKVVDVGIYEVTFGKVIGYRKPAAQSVPVYADATPTVTGVYVMTNGTLTITTKPAWWGEVFVNGVSWGTAPQSRTVQTGTYTVSFGAIDGFTSPTSQVVTVNENAETRVTGTYEPKSGTVTAEITDPDNVSSQNPFILDAIDDASVHLTITEASAPITIIVRNVTDADDAPPPGTWKLLGNCVQIIVNNTDVTLSATLRIYYTLDQLEAAGLDESTLKIHYWNATAGQWDAAESYVDTSEHYVWTVIHHFSKWAIMGQNQAQTPALPWFIIAAVVVIVALIVVVAVFARKRKTPTAAGKP